MNSKRLSEVLPLAAIILGVGSVGSALAMSLAIRGFRRFILVDPDTIAAHNCSRNSLFSSTSVGCSKVEVIGALLESQFPQVEVVLHCCYFEDLGWQEFQSNSLIFCCTDSDLSRVRLSQMMVLLGRDWVDCGLLDDGSPCFRVSFFANHSLENACFCCLLSSDRRALTLAHSHSFHKSCADLPVIDSSRIAQPLAVLCAETVASRFTSETSRLMNCSYVLESSSPGLMEAFQYLSSPSCPFHDVPLPLPVQIPEQSDLSVSKWLLNAGFEDPQVFFPIAYCFGIHCGNCGSKMKDPVRLDRFRINPTCACCGGKLAPESTASFLSTRSSWSSLPLSAFHFPANHLLLVQESFHLG